MKVDKAAPTKPIIGIKNRFNKMLNPAVKPWPSILSFCLPIDDKTMPSRKLINFTAKYNDIICRAVIEAEYLLPYNKSITLSANKNKPKDIGRPII